MLRRLLQQGGQGSFVGFQKRDDRWFVVWRSLHPIFMYSKQSNFDKILRRVGRCSDLVSKTRESLVSLGRLLSFFNETPKPELHTKTVLSDLASLSDHASFISTKVNFLLDATLGLINNEQNGIIKIVSVAAVVFLPPTLVASVYGMNFEVMPELKWVLGYPFAVFLMISSAVLPYVFFKRKGWL